MEPKKVVELSECCQAPTKPVLDDNMFVRYWICSFCGKPALPYNKVKDEHSGLEIDMNEGFDWTGSTR